MYFCICTSCTGTCIGVIVLVYCCTSFACTCIGLIVFVYFKYILYLYLSRSNCTCIVLVSRVEAGELRFQTKKEAGL